jgi:hypothetical protein
MIMMIVFAWRRMNRGRLLVHPIRPAPRTAKKPIVLGEKPALWDVWTRREEPEARDVSMMMDMRWENITVRKSLMSGGGVVLMPYWVSRRHLALLRNVVLSDRA